MEEVGLTVHRQGQSPVHLKVSLQTYYGMLLLATDPGSPRNGGRLPDRYFNRFALGILEASAILNHSETTT
jgi:hypothetical protein